MFKYLELKIPPVVVVLLFSITIYGMNLLLPSALNYEYVRYILSAFFVTLGASVAFMGVIQFKSASTTVDPRYPQKSKTLVRGGIYQLTRNPMYVGMFFFLLSFCIYLGSLYSLILPLLFCLYMTFFQIIPEENALEKIFGQEYLEYKTIVNRWV